MAYTYFAEVAEGRSGSVDQRYQRSYKRTFLVKTSSSTYGPYYAGSHPSLPAVWTVHPEDAYAYCTGFSVDQDQGDPLLWRVVASYAYNADTASSGGSGGSSGGTGPTGNPAIDTQQQGQAPADRIQSPLSRPRDYQISGATSTTTVLTDVTSGNPIQNSAGDLFFPPVEKNIYGGLVTVGLNNATAPSNAWFTARGKTNAASLTIGVYTFVARTCRLNDVSASLVYENGVSYWRWTLVFEVKPLNSTWTTNSFTLASAGGAPIELGWMAVLLDQGKRDQAGNDLLDSITGLPVTQPVLLDGSGARLAPAGTEKYRAFHIYPTVTFPSPL